MLPVKVNESKKNDGNYSVINEQSYSLRGNVSLPILKFLKDDMITLYKVVLDEFVRFCVSVSYNPNATTTWFYFVRSVMLGKVVPKDGRVNLLKRKLINLSSLYANAVQAASDSCATVEPEVKFVSNSVEADGSYTELQEEKGVPTKEAMEARKSQGALKDELMRRIVKDPRPVLDLGGGKGALIKSLSKVGIVDKQVVNYDQCAALDYRFERLKLSNYPTHQILMNHSSYHVPYALFSQILVRKPRGITMVLDGVGDEIEVSGEDYCFKAVRDTRLPDVEAYLVTGKLFCIKSTDGKGRSFENEHWYTRRQWSKWGFDLYVDPADRSKFVRDHVVLFDWLPRMLKTIPAVGPSSVSLSEGRVIVGRSKKMAVMKELFVTDREKDLRCYMGQTIYQTPKLDGICMKLICGERNKTCLIDRMGLVYDVLTKEKVTLNWGFESLVELIVEVMPNGNGTYDLYLDQVLAPDPLIEKEDAVQELIAYVSMVNKRVKYNLLGLKDYYPTRNKILQLKTTLPYDGVVYFNSRLTSKSASLMGKKVLHSFSKPFSGTDTAPFVILGDSKIIGQEFNVLYRSFEIDDSKSVVVPVSLTSSFSDQVDSIMRSSVLNSSDYFGPTTISPLVYEGYYIPKECLRLERDSFVITHVRGDKPKRAFAVERTRNLDWIKHGIIGLTKWGDNAEDVACNFFLNLTSRRVMKILPSNVGVQTMFLANFLDVWRSSKEDGLYADLNRCVRNGIYEGDVDELIINLRKVVGYDEALFIMDTLFRYPFVKRNYGMVGKKIVTRVSFDLKADFRPCAIDLNMDAVSGVVFKQGNCAKCNRFCEIRRHICAN